MAVCSRSRLGGVFLAWALLVAPSAGAAAPPEGKGGLHIARARPASFTTYLNDGAGYRWDIQYYLNVGQGTGNAYSSGLYCRVNGTNISSNGRGWMNPAGDEIEIGPHNLGSVMAYRRCKVYRDQGLARWLDIFVNRGNTRETIAVQIYTRTQTSISRTISSSGAGVFGPKDWAFITEHQMGRPALLHVVCGPGGKVRPSINASGTTIYYNYNLIIPPRGTAVLCYFESQGRSVTELDKRLKGFRLPKVLADLSLEVRKLIVNFGVRDQLEEVELDRSGTSDAVILKNGDSVFGRIANERFTLEAFYGTLELAADEVLGFAQVAGRDELVRAVLVGGQVVTGKLRDNTLTFALPTGGELKIPFSRIKQCSYRISEQKPAECEMSDPLIVLRTGDRLAFDAGLLDVTFQTRHGTIALSGGDLMEVRLQREEHGVHRAVFSNGAKLAGLLGPEKIVLPLKLGPKLSISRDMVVLIRFAAEVKDDPELSRARLSNDDELFGRLADAEYRLATDFGTVKVNPKNISAMAFDPLQPTRVAVELWDGSTLRGRLQQEALRFALKPGPVLSLHVGHLVEVRCPGALPPEDVIKRVQEYVAKLSAPNYADREDAQKALEQMGRRIVPLLKSHLQDADPEVRHRITVILENLGAGSEDSPADPAPPPFGAINVPGEVVGRW